VPIPQVFKFSQMAESLLMPIPSFVGQNVASSRMCSMETQPEFWVWIITTGIGTGNRNRII